MSRYKHVLFAADLQSEDDKSVGSQAKMIAESMQATLSIVHTLEYPTYASGAFFDPEISVTTPENFDDMAKERLDQVAEKLGIPKERRHLPIGSPKTQILEVAKKVKADLIVVGSHGRSGLELFLLGSTANAILHHAECDILTVRVNGKKSK